MSAWEPIPDGTPPGRARLLDGLWSLPMPERQKRIARYRLEVLEEFQAALTEAKQLGAVENLTDAEELLKRTIAAAAERITPARGGDGGDPDASTPGQREGRRNA